MSTQDPDFNAMHRELMARGHKVWRDQFGCYCVEAGNGASFIPEADWDAADAALQTEIRAASA